MAKRYTLQANTRTATASAARQGGAIPAVLYGRGLKSQTVQVDYKELNKVYQNAGSTSLVMLKLDGKSDHPVLIRELQLHPLRSTVMHVDFYQVRMDEEIRALVPLHFEGTSSAVKDKGGVFVRSMDEIEVEALPQDLPHDISVDISVLDNFEKVIRIADLKLPKGVTILHEDDEVIALVQAPRTEAELEELTAEVKEDVESVEGVKKEEAEEGADAEAEAEEKKEE
jgi:large subunit ribosomal protein L25